MWACGLKQVRTYAMTLRLNVAPRVGVWIETIYECVSVLAVARRAPCGRVD